MESEIAKGSQISLVNLFEETAELFSFIGVLANSLNFLVPIRGREEFVNKLPKQDHPMFQSTRGVRFHQIRLPLRREKGKAEVFDRRITISILRNPPRWVLRAMRHSRLSAIRNYGRIIMFLKKSKAFYTCAFVCVGRSFNPNPRIASVVSFRCLAAIVIPWGKGIASVAFTERQGNGVGLGLKTVKEVGKKIGVDTCDIEGFEEKAGNMLRGNP
ncbi:hypothetical protein Tco_1533593 [Tanacetum coccineum]